MGTSHSVHLGPASFFSRLGTACLALAAHAWPGAHGRRHEPMDASLDLFEHSQGLSVKNQLVDYHAGRKDFCVVSHHMKNEAPYAVVSGHNHHAYAKHHDYQYYGFRGRISGDMFVDARHGDLDDKFGGGLYWQELSALAWVAGQQNKAGGPACRWLMWMDADAIYTNFHLTMDSLVRHFAEIGEVDKDVILAREDTDYLGSFINAGVFLVKNSAGGREFLREVAARFIDYNEAGKFADQGAIQDYALGQLTTDQPMSVRAELETGARDNVAIIPQRAMNSFYWRGDLQHDAHTSRASEWEPCDWVLHIASRNTQDRRRHIEQRMQSVLDC